MGKGNSTWSLPAMGALVVALFMQGVVGGPGYPQALGYPRVQVT